MSYSRISVIAVGINNYQFLKRLSGTEKDLDKIESLLFFSNETAILDKANYYRHVNITSADLRSILSQYVLSRSAQNDVLIFYFSGHGVPLSENDFGFCTVDTQIFTNGSEAPIPLNLVRFSDIVESLAVARIDPIFILDTCYSGQAGEAIEKSYKNLEDKVKHSVGSAYVILCACTKYEKTNDVSYGGIFSNILTEVGELGIGKDRYRNLNTLTIQDLFPKIKEMAERKTDISPKLFLGETPLNYPIIKNIKYNPRIESLSPHYNTLIAFWNSGSPRELNTKELHSLGSTIHTTYSKLSYKPAWGLIEKPKKGIGILSEKGVLFMQNKLKVPDIIQKNPQTDDWEKADYSKMIKFSDMKK